MQKRENNYAFIDGANLHWGVSSLDWKLDYKRFRVWLEDKYSVKQAYIFIGLIAKYAELYRYLQESGFILVFKEVIFDENGKAKGNCDADLVLHAVCGCYENKFDKAIVVASDGDYAGLVSFFQGKGKLSVLLSPSVQEKCSILLKRTGARIAYVNDQRSLLELNIKEKAPDEDEPHKGL